MKQNNRKSAFAVICWNDKILLFHRDDIPTIPYPDHWSLPGGAVEIGETPLQGLKRELMEEVSYIPKKIIYITKVQTEISLSHLYICFVNDNDAKKFKPVPGEGQEIKFFTIKEALNLKLAPSIRFRLETYGSELEEVMIKKKVTKSFLSKVNLL